MPTANNTQATHSIAELITEFYKLKGTIPPLLIGATTTLVDNHIYLFGGRLHSTRQISNDVYVLSLDTKTWSIVKPQNEAPCARYFHSASHFKHYIYFFGGMGVQENKEGVNEVVPLNDLSILNIKTMAWEYPNLNESTSPSPRYAHLSTIIKNKFVVVGGQNEANEYFQDIYIFDIKKKKWCPPLSSQNLEYGAYRSAAVAVTPIELTPTMAPTTLDSLSTTYEENPVSIEDSADIHIHIYSNVQTSPDANRCINSWRLNHIQEVAELQDQPEQINMGHVSPPPLKFPTAFMCGQQFILAGPHFSPTQQQFQMWALDTTTYIWTKIEAGHVLACGSWLRGMLNENSNQFIVFGHPQRSMQQDYKDRVHSFEHLACVDMEIFGIYKPPRTSFNPCSQNLGLELLKDPVLADLRIVTTDKQNVSVNSALLSQRWPTINSVIQPLVEPQEDQAHMLDFEKRELSFPDTYVVLVAFLQYIYTDHLVTAQQHQPHILARLLLIADLFDIDRLKKLVVHALHQMLNIQTAAMIYEAAALSKAVSLQIRALRVMINAKKMLQRQKQHEIQQRQQRLQQQQLQLQQKQQQQQMQLQNPRSPTINQERKLSVLPSIPTTSPTHNLTSQNSQQHLRQLLQQQSLQKENNSFKIGGNDSISEQSQYHHHRTSSQKSIQEHPQSAPSTPPANKSIKLPHFRSMRHTSSSPSIENSKYDEPQYINGRLTSSNPSIPAPSSSRSTGNFWRQNTSTSSLSKMKNAISGTPSKSDSSVKLSSIPFLNNLST